MKMTVLQMTQNILSALESDEIDSVSDTPEGEAVAEALKEVYYQMVSNQVIPEHKALCQLTSAGASLVFMQIPATVHNLEWIKYNVIETGGTQNQYTTIPYKSPPEFMQMLMSRNSSDTNVVSATDPTSSIAIDMFQNDKPPEHWTSFDDEYICFDSYDAAVDASGLVASKTLCWATVEPETFETNDDFIPDMDDHLFPYLLAEAKSLCFMNMKQTANSKVDKQARQQRFAIQNDKFRTREAQEEGFNASGPDYGRRRR
jgi:hypothetical protein